MQTSNRRLRDVHVLSGNVRYIVKMFVNILNEKRKKLNKNDTYSATAGVVSHDKRAGTRTNALTASLLAQTADTF